MNTVSGFQFLARNSFETTFRRWKGFIHKGGRPSTFGGPSFFPRRETDEDVVIVPSKLFRVERIKRVKTTTRIQREIMKHFGIDQMGKQVTVVKNIPENNNKLWVIKHLITVHPITFPHGDLKPEDVDYGFLKENGECIVAKELKLDHERLEASDNEYNDPKRMDGFTIQKDCRLKWLNGYTGGF